MSPYFHFHGNQMCEVMKRSVQAIFVLWDLNKIGLNLNSQETIRTAPAYYLPPIVSISLPARFCIHFFLYIPTCIIHAPIWIQTLHLKHQISLYCSRKFPNSFLTYQFSESFWSAYNDAFFFHLKKTNFLFPLPTLNTFFVPLYRKFF